VTRPAEQSRRRRTGEARGLRVHRELLQPEAPPLGARLRLPGAVRGPINQNGGRSRRGGCRLTRGVNRSGVAPRRARGLDEPRRWTEARARVDPSSRSRSPEHAGWLSHDGGRDWTNPGAPTRIPARQRRPLADRPGEGGPPVAEHGLQRARNRRGWTCSRAAFTAVHNREGGPRVAPLASAYEAAARTRDELTPETKPPPRALRESPQEGRADPNWGIG
jgi:hypothetical protein